MTNRTGRAQHRTSSLVSGVLPSGGLYLRLRCLRPSEAPARPPPQIRAASAMTADFPTPTSPVTRYRPHRAADLEYSSAESLYQADGARIAGELGVARRSC